MPVFRRSASLSAGLAALLLSAAPGGARELAVTTPDTSLSGNYLAGQLASRERDADAAAAYFAAALRADPQNADLLERTFLWMVAEGDVEQSMKMAERIIQVNPSQREARLALAIRAIKAKQYLTARTHLAQGLRGPLADLTTQLLTAWTQLGSGDVAKAIKTGDDVKGADWVSAFRDFNVGLIAALGGDDKRSLSELRSAIDTDKTADRPVLALARIQARDGDKAAALATLGTLDEAQNHPVVKQLRAEIESGKPVERLVGDPRQGAAEVLYGFGAALARERGEDLATVYLRLALYLDPRFDMAQASLADLYQRLGQYDHAVAAYDTIADTSPLRPRAAINAALALDRLDRTEEAVAKLQALVKDDPANYEAIVGLGRILANRKRFPEAAETYDKAVALVTAPDRSNWTLFYLRGMALERSDQWPKAEADLKRALELSPDQPAILNYLGYSWVDKGQNLDQGMDMIKRAVQLEPDDGYIVDSLGWAYFRLGQYDQAVDELERAVELRPQDSVLNDHLGDAYWRIGRRVEAQFQWAHAKQLGPEPDELPKIDAKLKDGLPDIPPNNSADADAKPKAETKPNGG